MEPTVTYYSQLSLAQAYAKRTGAQLAISTRLVALFVHGGTERESAVSENRPSKSPETR